MSTSLRTMDRRRTPRFKRLVTLNIDIDGRLEPAVTLDIGPGGAYISTRHGLPAGHTIDLAYRAASSPDAPFLLRSRVLRSIAHAPGASRPPGIAVEFETVATRSGRAALLAFLGEVLGMTRTQDGLLTTSASGELSFQLPRNGVPVEPEGGRLRLLHPVPPSQVHAARVSPDRCLPHDARSAEALLRALACERERRKHPRFPVRVDVTYYVGEVPHAASVLNLGRHGMFLQTDHDPPAVGGRISLRFPVTGEPNPFFVKVDGIVRRHWDPAGEVLPGFGIRLERVDESGRNGIYRVHLRRLGNPTLGRRFGYHYSAHR